MCMKLFRQFCTQQQKQVKPFRKGEELRVTMRDQTYRVVLIMHVFRTKLRVSELFRGVYLLHFKDVQTVYVGKHQYSANWLLQRARCSVK